MTAKAKVCSVKGHPITGEYIAVEEPGPLAPSLVCLECLAEATPDDRAEWIDEALIGRGHNCVDHGTVLAGMVFCAVCAAMLQDVPVQGGPVVGVAISQGRTGWWLYVTANGQRISGALWCRPTLAEAERAKPDLLAHWQRVQTDVYGSVSAGLAEAARIYGVTL